MPNTYTFFIDESGDSGTKKIRSKGQGGATPYMILGGALVLYIGTLSLRQHHKNHLIFASARFVSKKVLKEEKINVAFMPLPHSLYRLEREE